MSWLSSLLGLDAQKNAGEALGRQSELAERAMDSADQIYNPAALYYKMLMEQMAGELGLNPGTLSAPGVLPGQTGAPAPQSPTAQTPRPQSIMGPMVGGMMGARGLYRIPGQQPQQQGDVAAIERMSRNPAGQQPGVGYPIGGRQQQVAAAPQGQAAQPAGYSPYAMPGSDHYLNRAQEQGVNAAIERAGQAGNMFLRQNLAQTANAGLGGGSGTAGAVRGISLGQHQNVLQSTRDLSVANEQMRYQRYLQQVALQNQARERFMQLLNPGLSAGGAQLGAAGVFGDVANSYGQQAQNAGGLLGGLFDVYFRAKEKRV